MSITGKKIAVIGGGVSGLAAGAVAALRGAQVTIFERSSGPSSAGNGTGLQISPNGVRVLKALGWPDRWALPFEKARTLRMKHGPSGKTLASLDLRSRTGDANYMLVRRSDLVASLAQCAQDHGASLITNTPADVTFDQDRFRVVTDGQSAPNDFEIVIAADGIHSMLRQRHLPGGVAASATGQLAWRALTPVSAVTEELQEELLEGPCLFVGPGMHLVTYLVPDGTMINVVAVAPNSARDTNFSQVGQPDSRDHRFVERFSGWCDAARSVLENSTETDVRDLFRGSVPASLFHANLVAIGDAAHPLLPHLAQGASAALEDAWTLIALLARERNHHVAFAAYDRARRARVHRLQRASERSGRIYRLRNPLVRLPLHLGLRAARPVMPFVLRHWYGWVHDHDVVEQYREG